MNNIVYIEPMTFAYFVSQSSKGTLLWAMFRTKPVGRGGAWGAYAPSLLALKSTLCFLSRLVVAGATLNSALS